METTVLIITNKDDEHVEPVVKHLTNLGQKFYRFNSETFPLEIAMKLDLSGGYLLETSKRDCRIDLTSVKSVWFRRPTPPLFTNEGLSDGYVKFIKNESEIALWSLYTTLEVFWVNPPLVNSRLIQRNKLYQLKGASQVGFTIPATIITNDPNELLNFSEVHGGTIAVKLLKGDWFLKKGSDIPLFVFTQQISSAYIKDHFEDIKLAPIFAQEYIQKQLELRITIVGEQIFSCAIYSQDSEQTKIDWRNYDLENVKHESYQLPSEIEKKLLQLMKKWQLNYGAIDMILTPEGDFVFLEINPSGQWLWIEKLTGLPISVAMAELLSNPIVITNIPLP